MPTFDSHKDDYCYVAEGIFSLSDLRLKGETDT